MPGMNLSQIRVVDPVLTTIAQGFKQPALIGNALFPVVPVGVRAGRILSFGKEDFMLYNTARTPGSNTKRLKFGYASGTFALVDYSLEGQLALEDIQESDNNPAGPGVDLMSMTVNKTMESMALGLEYAQATLARTAASYQAANKTTLSGTSQWSDYGTTSNPVAVIETAKEAVRAAIGKRPNTIVMGAAVMSKLRAHPLIVDRVKYTGRDVATPELLASLFGVQRVLVGDSIYMNDAGTTITDVWGKDVVVAYTELGSIADRGNPSYGYTYNLSGYPMVEQPYFERNPKSWFAPVTRVEAPVIAAVNAGYLITNAVA